MTRWGKLVVQTPSMELYGNTAQTKGNVVLVVGPHTSYKDFILVLACQKLTKMEFEFFLDPSSFKWYLRPILTALRDKKDDN